MRNRFGLAACVFVLSLTSTALARDASLEQVLGTIAQNASKGVKSIVIMDLDETVVDTHSRMHSAFLATLKELCGSPSATLRAPKTEDCERALGLSKYDFYRAENGYSLESLAKLLGIREGEFTKTLLDKTVKNYLSGKWMDSDSSMPGASEYVRAMKRAGALVYFVSSRYEDTQLKPTYAQLIELGFIQESEKPFVILRKRGMDSVDFKTKTAQRIEATSAKDGTPVVAIFENEPENLNAWVTRFPKAKAIFVKGNILNTRTAPHSSAISIESYR